MQGRHYIENLLDLLIEMADHCIHKDKPIEDKAKCVGCALSWTFSLRNHGCLLVNMIDNEDLIGDIMNVCEANNIDYRDKINKLYSITKY